VKKFCTVVVFSVLCVGINAFEHRGFYLVDDLNNYNSGYEFFYVNLNSTADILSFGMLIGRGEWNTKGIDNWWGVIAITSAQPVRVIENNTSLRQVMKDKMNQIGANVSITIDNDACIYVNILMPDGRYTTIVYY
jgi:hypothetical protein